ncbi:hypothetical protein M885DRAFT_116489 [Pelagophyceae sp. CCMP2097]|nr:hypothetical protein M885DRAFT_116489 [Pelagophyceae sp. CCMP2097]
MEMLDEVKGLRVGDRVCLAEDSSWRGVVESQVFGGRFSVRFSDKDRTLHCRELVLLQPDDDAFSPSPAPLSWVELQRLKFNVANRGVRVGVHVRLVRDAAVRGIVETLILGGEWTVHFADTSRNLHVDDLEVLPPDAAFVPSPAPPSREQEAALLKDLAVLPSDAAFVPSPAPPSSREQKAALDKADAAERGCYVGANVCLAGDASRRGTVEASVSNGWWAVKFVDGTRSFRARDLRVLQPGAAFVPSQAPKSASTQRAVSGDGAACGGRRGGLAPAPAPSATPSQASAAAAEASERAATAEASERAEAAEASERAEAAEASEASEPATAAQRKAARLVTVQRGVCVGARVCFRSDAALRGTVVAKGDKGWWTVRFADDSRPARSSHLTVLSPDDPEFAPSLAPPSSEAKMKGITEKVRRGLYVGARVCVKLDPAVCGTVEALISGGCWTVLFADASSTLRAMDLTVLPPDDAAFSPSPAPLSLKAKAKKRSDEAKCGLYVKARVCLGSDPSRRGVVEAANGGWWTVRFADDSQSFRATNLTVLPSDDAAFALSPAPKKCPSKRAVPGDGAACGGPRGGLAPASAPSAAHGQAGGAAASEGGEEPAAAAQRTTHPALAQRAGRVAAQHGVCLSARVGRVAAQHGVCLGARVCLVSDAAFRGTVDAAMFGGCWTVRFADTTRNLRVVEIMALPPDDAAFVPSLAPPHWKAKRDQKSEELKRGLRVGERVCFKGDPAVRGTVEALIPGGCWTVLFADASRTVRVTDLTVLPSDDAAFVPSPAPLSWEAKGKKRSDEAKRGLYIKARVCLESDPSRRGVVEAANGGWWTVRFADDSRVLRTTHLTVLPPDDAAFALSPAPPKLKGPVRRTELDEAVRGGPRGGLAPASAPSVARDQNIEAGAAAEASERGDEPAAAAHRAAHPALAQRAGRVAAQHGVCLGARVCLVSDAAFRGTVDAAMFGGYWTVRFADTTRNLRVVEIMALPPDDAAFVPSLAPLHWKEKLDKKAQEKKAQDVKRGFYVGARVCVKGDPAIRGTLEKLILGGCWTVLFADATRNVRVTDLAVLPSDDAAFSPSPAPPHRTEVAKKRGLNVGERVCLESDPSRHGVVEAVADGGWWTVRFADDLRSIRPSNLTALPPDDAAFVLSPAPPKVKGPYCRAAPDEAVRGGPRDGPSATRTSARFCRDESPEAGAADVAEGRAAPTRRPRASSEADKLVRCGACEGCTNDECGASAPRSRRRGL